MCQNCNCDENLRLLEEVTRQALEIVDDCNRKDIIIDGLETEIVKLQKLIDNYKGGM